MKPFVVFLLVLFSLSTPTLFAQDASGQQPKDKDADKKQAASSSSTKKDQKKDEKKEPPKEEKKGGMTEETFSGLKFRLIGPAVASGRVMSIAVNPKKTDEYYVGVASGGVWKTRQ